jgi:transcriptional regulator
MYRPPTFSVDDQDELFDMIERSPFGNLVTSSNAGLEATGLPMIIDRDRDDLGVLRCHIARANGHWQSMDGIDALVFFQLVDGYISPSWYPSKAEHGKVVPTWNYEIVHAHGTVRIQDDVEWVRQLVTDLTDRHESSMLGQRAGRPWRVSDAPDDYIDRQLRAIVGVEIELTRLEGKRKLSQNRSDDDRIGVAGSLAESPSESDHSLGEAMRSTM